MDKQTATAVTKQLRVLFSAFPTAARTDELTVAQTYLGVLDGFSLEAIERSVGQFTRGQVPKHDGRFAPSAAELASNVREWDQAIRFRDERRNAKPLASGILSVDFGSGPIDMTRLALEEQDMVLRTGRAPDMRLGNGITAKLQRMGERNSVTNGDLDGERDVA